MHVRSRLGDITECRRTKPVAVLFLTGNAGPAFIPKRDAQAIELPVTQQRPAMTGNAARLAPEQLVSCPGICREGLLLTGEEAVKR